MNCLKLITISELLVPKYLHIIIIIIIIIIISYRLYAGCLQLCT